MQKLTAILLSLFISTILLAQVQPAVVDSIKRKIASATKTEEKIELLGNLSKILMNVNLQDADKYGFEMLTLAEQSRNRTLMVKALLANGERYSYLAGRKDNIEKAISYYNQGLELACLLLLASALSFSIRCCL